ncbi:MAG TPA: LCP family protein, partial [Candidatus Limnocylindrales bacterium]
VDALGKVWINVPFKMVDYAYPNPATGAHMKMVIQKGCQQMDGFTALAFARIRHIDSDYARMGRQQVVLDALARQLDPMTVLTKLPDLLSIAGKNLTTTFTADDAATLAQFATTMDVHHIRNITFVPPKYPEFLTPAVIARIQKVVQNVFVVKPAASPTPFDSPLPSTTPAPTRTPAPTPVPCPAS